MAEDLWLFEEDGDSTFVPTSAAVGPWSEQALHGGAVSALLAGILQDDEHVTTRLLIELVGPAPRRPLTVTVEPPEGGRRVLRQAAVLSVDGREYARARSLRMRRADLPLPAEATAHPVIFDPASVPDLSTAPHEVAKPVANEDRADLS